MTVHEGRVPVASVAGRPDMVITASMPRRPASLMVRLRSSPWVISGSGCTGLQASDDAVGSPILMEGRVDFEFTARRPDNPDVHWQHLLSQPLALSVPAGHRLADRDEVSITEAAEEFVMLRPTWILRALPESSAHPLDSLLGSPSKEMTCRWSADSSRRGSVSPWFLYRRSTCAPPIRPSSSSERGQPM